MDRPLGPRHPPDKRNEAYESIFGRPSTSHQQAGQYYHHPYQQQPAHGQPAYQPVNKRTSHSASIRSQQSYYNHLQQQPRPQQHPPYHHHPYPAHHALAPPSTTHGRAPSVVSSPHNAAGIIPPRPDDPPDPSLNALTRAGLTPAQAYRAQVNLNSHSPTTAPHNGVPHGTDIPRIGVHLEEEIGHLNFDFGSQDNNPHDRPSSEFYSELPWAQPTPEHSRAFAMSIMSISAMTSLSQTNVAAQHHRQPSPLSLSSGPHTPPYHLQLDTTTSAVKAATRSSSVSISPVSSTLVDHSMATGSLLTTAARRSSESARTMPGPASRRDRNGQDRTLSMSAASASLRTLVDPRSRAPIPHGFQAAGRNSPSRPSNRVRAISVYPALLSRVAEAFKARIILADRVKDGLTYKDAFDGREAVDKIAAIIKTTDRNLALLLGRALDAQKFFHDVTYDHRLRDSAGELYQFRTTLSPFVSGELAAADNNDHNGDGDEEVKSPEQEYQPDVKRGVSLGHGSADSHGGDGLPAPGTIEPLGRQGSESMDEVPLPTGVFTLLSDCYSPTCSRDQLCYSIACPRRLEQQSRLNMKPQPGLKKQISKESLGDLVEPGTLWIHSVPQEVVNSVSDTEKKRQEAINEVIYTERDFVRDMEYLRDTWIGNLKDSDIIPADRRTDFIQQVFWNIHEIIAVNTRLRDALNKRQKAYAVVERIGDIFIDVVPNFAPFVSYGAHQLYGKYEFEKEKSSNPAFAAFVETTERLPESRKLELNGYLTKPTTRLARYPLLLEAVLKHTSEDNVDKQTLAQVVSMVREFLAKVNVETGKAENRFNLMQLDQQLVFRPGEYMDLRLQDPQRELVYKGSLNKRGGQGDNGDLLVYLFDHALLMVKQKSKHEQYKVHRRPIPLDLLFISVPDENAQGNRPANRPPRTLTKRNSLNRGAPYAPAIPVRIDGKGGLSITFVHLGRKFYQLTLWASTIVSHRKWVENITKQQELLKEKSTVFETVTVSEGFFTGVNKVTCAAPFGGGRHIVYGTDDGVYLTDLREPNRDPVKVLALLDVSQVDVLEDYQLLIVLSERQVVTFPLDALDRKDPTAGLRRAKRISSHTSFFKAGICLGKVLVCVVKSSPLSSTIKTLEPIDQNVRGRSKPTFRKLIQGGNDTLKLFREFYIPVESSSIHFLKTKLCVGCSKGFEIVDLESLDTQGLLDPADASLEFVRKKENLRPMAIYRIDNEFLLCYDDFAFYVNKNGWRSRQEFMVHWEGSPTGFALHYPYVLAFEPMFVEVRHVETGAMSQVIQGNNLRLLFAESPPSTSHTTNLHQNTYYPAQQQGYHPYQSPPGSMYGRSPSMSGYGPAAAPPLPPMFPAPQYPMRTMVPSCRDEILMVSDDRVLTLRLANGHGFHITSDTASTSSR
ncbi:CNH-domain-containing protein [Pisolithus marmoratus]|nr:CNH-domain-containing protein [Pisolithus marmoratus]